MFSVIDFQAVALLITFLANVFMGLLIYSRGKKNPNNISYALVVLLVVLWTASMFFYREAGEGTVLAWGRVLYACATFVSSLFLLFTYIFPKGDLKLRKLQVFLLFLPNIFLALLIIFTDFIIKEVIVIPGEENLIIFGKGYFLYIAYILSYFFLGFLNLFQSYRTSTGAPRTQLKYVFLGYFIAANIAFVTNLLIPWWGNMSLNWAGQVATIIWVGLTTYAILKYRLMDIRFALSRGVIYFLSFLHVIAITLLFSFAFEIVFPEISREVLLGLLVVVAIGIFGPVFEFFQRIGAKYFHYTSYNYQKVLTDLGKGLTRIIDLDQLSVLVTNTLLRTMKLDRAVILLRKEGGVYEIQRNIGFKEDNGISLVKDNFLTNYLEKTKKPLVYEELSLLIKDTQDKKEREKIEALQSNMRRIEASLCLPLILEGKIIGMIVLGEKLSGDPYFEQDIELLSGLASQASIAFKNAMLYAEVQDLSSNLEKKVDEQVRELREAYKKLQRIDKAKTEFMSIVSHQLRTPLSIIKGHLSMIREGVYDNDKEKKEKVLTNIYEANERLIDLINDVLNISRIQAGRVEINKEKVDLARVVKETVEKMEKLARDKGVEIVFYDPSEKMPEAEIDVSKTENVLLNILDNALKYTNEGKVEVSLKKENDRFILIEIRDTGEGMKKEEIEKLFATFSRGDAGKKHWIQGSGLGLYIARQFAEMQGGKIWADSEGEGKGSQFYIRFPRQSD